MLLNYRRLEILTLFSLATSLVFAKNRNVSPTIEKPQDPDILKILHPSGSLKLVTLGSGEQLYICNGTAWTPNGAAANLYDITQKPELWKNITNTYKNSKYKADKELIAAKLVKIGKHTFVPDPKGKKVPRFEIGKHSVLAVKNVVMPSPLHPELNVPWLSLNVTKGDFAESVLRVSTRGGVAPKAGCKNPDLKKPEEFKSQYFALVSFKNT
ncbi:hypothetical protein PPACK8108_LOCUS19564 [Phakopsora pachyrhizi]|uniref:Uncharacterized protein n=1 Tax=Phakopsora pachyrhizi TaxID=170000 RepID=A0AAV0BFB0_PHAPC|nr:hypothetical protein PPACK8108_LOCUS19564 [Phakopsora pachyrhizi]